MAWLVSMLMIVVASGSVACKRSAAADTTAVFADTNSALLADAARAGDTASVTKLVAGGASPSAVGTNGTSVLEWSMAQGKTAGFVALLDAGADPLHTDVMGDTVLHRAAQNPNPEYLNLLLARHLDPNAMNPVSGSTPLMKAVTAKQKIQIHALLAAKADVRAADLVGDTALHLAGETNQGALCVELLNAGADPTARNHQGVTFQSYLYMPPEDLLNDEARAGRNAVTTWLNQHNFPLENAQAQRAP